MSPRIWRGRSKEQGTIAANSWWLHIWASQGGEMWEKRVIPGWSAKQFQNKTQTKPPQIYFWASRLCFILTLVQVICMDQGSCWALLEQSAGSDHHVVSGDCTEAKVNSNMGGTTSCSTLPFSCVPKFLSYTPFQLFKQILLWIPAALFNWNYFPSWSPWSQSSCVVYIRNTALSARNSLCHEKQ